MLDFIYNNQFLIIIITIVMVMAAQASVKGVTNKYLKVKSPINLTGEEVARKIMMNNGITDVKIETTNSPLGDHYDPAAKTVRLSNEVYAGNSITSHAIAAHEVGHVIQHHEGSLFLKARTAFFPLAAFGSKGAWFIIIAGFIFSMTGLIWIGIVLFSLTVIFQLITLPVEFDASNRAIKQLNNFSEIGTRSDSIVGFKKVLRAAAMTYVAATLASVLTLLRLVSNARR